MRTKITEACKALVLTIPHQELHNQINTLTQDDLRSILRRAFLIDVEVGVYTRPDYFVTVVDSNASVHHFPTENENDHTFPSYEEALEFGLIQSLTNLKEWSSNRRNVKPDKFVLHHPDGSKSSGRIVPEYDNPSVERAMFDGIALRKAFEDYKSTVDGTHYGATTFLNYLLKLTEGESPVRPGSKILSENRMITAEESINRSNDQLVAEIERVEKIKDGFSEPSKTKAYTALTMAKEALESFSFDMKADALDMLKLITTNSNN